MRFTRRLIVHPPLGVRSARRTRYRRSARYSPGGASPGAGGGQTDSLTGSFYLFTCEREKRERIQNCVSAWHGGRRDRQARKVRKKFFETGLLSARPFKHDPPS